MTQKIKILILDQADFLGGAELFTIDLLNSYNPKIFEIHLASNSNPEYLNLIPKHVTWHQSALPHLKSFNPKSYINILKSIKSVNEILQKNKIDILQSNTIRTHLINSLSKAKKKIWFIHDFTFPRLLCKALSHRTDQIICCSNTIKQDIKNKINPKHHQKLQIIFNGINISSKQEKTKNSTPHIGLVGRIDWWKGQKEFILAAKEVLRKVPKAKFHIYGSPNPNDSKTIRYYKQIKDIIQKENLEKSIVLEGHQKHILENIKHLDILVHASIKPEPFGRVIIEAMSVQTPVIASPLGGTQEIIDHQVNGLLIDPRDTQNLSQAILNLIKHPETANQLSKNALQTVSDKFSLKVNTKNLEKIWYNLKQNKNK